MSLLFPIQINSKILNICPKLKCVCHKYTNAYNCHNDNYNKNKKNNSTHLFLRNGNGFLESFTRRIVSRKKSTRPRLCTSKSYRNWLAVRQISNKELFKTAEKNYSVPWNNELATRYLREQNEKKKKRALRVRSRIIRKSKSRHSKLSITLDGSKILTPSDVEINRFTKKSQNTLDFSTVSPEHNVYGPKIITPSNSRKTRAKNFTKTIQSIDLSNTSSKELCGSKILTPSNVENIRTQQFTRQLQHTAALPNLLKKHPDLNETKILTPSNVEIKRVQQFTKQPQRMNDLPSRSKKRADVIEPNILTASNVKLDRTQQFYIQSQRTNDLLNSSKKNAKERKMLTPFIAELNRIQQFTRQSQPVNYFPNSLKKRTDLNKIKILTPSKIQINLIQQFTKQLQPAKRSKKQLDVKESEILKASNVGVDRIQNYVRKSAHRDDLPNLSKKRQDLNETNILTPPKVKLDRIQKFTEKNMQDVHDLLNEPLKPFFSQFHVNENVSNVTHKNNIRQKIINIATYKTKPLATKKTTASKSPSFVSKPKIRKFSKEYLKKQDKKPNEKKINDAMRFILRKFNLNKTQYLNKSTEQDDLLKHTFQEKTILAEPKININLPKTTYHSGYQTKPSNSRLTHIQDLEEKYTPKTKPIKTKKMLHAPLNNLNIFSNYRIKPEQEEIPSNQCEILRKLKQSKKSLPINSFETTNYKEDSFKLNQDFYFDNHLESIMSDEDIFPSNNSQKLKQPKQSFPINPFETSNYKEGSFKLNQDFDFETSYDSRKLKQSKQFHRFTKFDDSRKKSTKFDESQKSSTKFDSSRKQSDDSQKSSTKFDSSQEQYTKFDESPKPYIKPIFVDPQLRPELPNLHKEQATESVSESDEINESDIDDDPKSSHFRKFTNIEKYAMLKKLTQDGHEDSTKLAKNGFFKECEKFIKNHNTDRENEKHSKIKTIIITKDR